MKVAEDESAMEMIRASARVSLGIERLQEELGLTGVAMNC